MGEEAGSSELIDFVLYMFVLGPAVEWCLKSPRVNKGKPGSKSGILLAVLLLTAVAGFKLSFDYVGRTPNHFETLGVRIDATSTQVKMAYRAISLKHHPDKNPDDKNAGEKFIKYQAAYEVLKDASRRDAYNKFGSADSQADDTGSKLMSLSLFYVIWIVVGYLLTMGKASEDGRTWAFSGLLTLAVFEYQTRILSMDYLAPLFPYSTVHEKVELLHKLFPPFMHGARMISQVIFMDIGLVNKLRLEEMHLKVDELMRTVVIMSGGGPPPAGGVALPAGAAGAISTDAAGGGESGKPLIQAAATAAEETAQRLAAQGQLPQLVMPGAAGAAGGAAGGAAAAGAAAGGGGASLTAEQQAAIEKEAREDAVMAKRNQDRMQSVVVFFIAYGVFKYAVDKELW